MTNDQAELIIAKFENIIHTILFDLVQLSIDRNYKPKKDGYTKSGEELREYIRSLVKE